VFRNLVESDGGHHKSKDSSKTEQMATVVRYVNIKDASIHERFLTFVEARSLDAEGLTKYMLDTLKDYHLDLESIVSQGYYGTSMMSGS